MNRYDKKAIALDCIRASVCIYPYYVHNTHEHLQQLRRVIEVFRRLERRLRATDRRTECFINANVMRDQRKSDDILGTFWGNFVLTRTLYLIGSARIRSGVGTLSVRSAIDTCFAPAQLFKTRRASVKGEVTHDDNAATT